MRFQEQSKLKAVTFSYDDGMVQDIHLIELMNKYGLKGTFNLNSEQLGSHPIRATKEGMRNCRYRLHPEDVRSVYEGHEIAAGYLSAVLLYPLSQGAALILSVLMASLFFREKLTVKAVIGICTAFAGLLIINLLY